MQEQVVHSQIHGRPQVGYQPGMALHLRIRQIRESRGETLETVAAKVGCSPPHLSQVERGLKNLNNHLLVKIAAALEVEPDELIASDVADPALRMAHKIRRLDDHRYNLVDEFVDALLTSQDSQRKK